VPAGLVGALLIVLVVLGVAVAGPAAAAEDVTRPQSHVLKGPSCSPGGMVIEVVARSVGYSVRLATTRRPQGEDSATLRPGQRVVLRSGDVAPGETIDSRLEYTALDASGTSFVDELTDWTFTRPTAADCVAATAAPSTGPATSGAAAGIGAQDPPASPPSTAAFETPAHSGNAGEVWSLLTAAVALVITVGGLVSVAGRQRAASRRA
jgi:hypothetical protein